MDNILMVVGVGAWALAAGSMGYMAAIAGTRDFDTTMKKIFISVMTVSCAITGGFVGYVLGRFAGF